MIKIKIAEGDTLIAQHNFTKENSSFVFIEMGDLVYYFDTTIGKMWLTDKNNSDEPLRGLGEGHKKLIMDY